MADRKAELERKKLKLEQMRKEREEKNRQRKVKEVKSAVSHCLSKVTFLYPESTILGLCFDSCFHYADNFSTFKFSLFNFTILMQLFVLHSHKVLYCIC